MLDKADVLTRLQKLVSQFDKLSSAFKKQVAERKAEDYVLEFFQILGWEKTGEEVIPQKKIRRGESADRVDYSFRVAGSIKPSLYVEVKKFAKDLDDPSALKQALDYGKNGGARWVVLTNFHKLRIFNSDFYDEPDNAELFQEIDLLQQLSNPLVFDQLLLLSRDSCSENKLDEYAKLHKKWKESADVEKLLTITLFELRSDLIKAFNEQNRPLFEGKKNVGLLLDECVQLLFDRVIFCRILEDNGVDEDRKLHREYERWEGDERVPFYSDYLIPFFEKMSKVYDSTIFEKHKIDGLRIKNHDFIPIFLKFYNSNGLRYRFDAIQTDTLGRVYENYLSYKARKTQVRVELEEELFKRKQSGIYYTPEFLVDYLVKNTLGKKLSECKKPSEALRIKVVDPACGSGTFLIRAYEEFRNWFKQHPEAHQTNLNGEEENGLQSFLDSVMEHCLYGIDLDPLAVELTRLNLFIRSIHNPKTLPKLHIINANSLVSDPEFDTPFIFENDFPTVYSEGGFDVVVTNPPWEKWKPDSQEFFEQRDLGFKSLPTQKAKARMQEILRKRPIAKKAWNEYNAHIEALSAIFRNEDNYQYQSGEVDGRRVSGDLDLYKLFTEKAFQLLKPGGLAGLVVPSGLYTDLGAKGVRLLLYEKCQIESLYSFENRGHKIFPDVHASYKPIVITFRKGGKTSKFPCAFFLHTEEDLQKAEKNPTILTIEFIKKSSPSSWNVLEIKSDLDYSIVNKLLEHPHLGTELKDKWNIQMTSGFHMTNDSHLFKPASACGIPLLEGKNIHQFTHQWKEAPKPRYSIPNKDVEANLNPEKAYHKGYWLAYRLIASSTNERTLISAVIPPGFVCGHSVAVVQVPDLKTMSYLCGVVNSFIADYFMRQKVSANITMFNFRELPVPRIDSGPIFKDIVKKVAQLTCTTSEYAKLREDVGIDFAVVNENDRKIVQAQIDALVAKLYGITESELAHILSKFPIVDEKTKELVLQEYEKL